MGGAAPSVRLKTGAELSERETTSSARRVFRPTADRRTPKAERQTLNAKRQTPHASLVWLQTMVTEEVHELLVVVRPNIEKDAHPAIAASGC
jgi:hypothetical protein